jgi:hypothetical protein
MYKLAREIECVRVETVDALRGLARELAFESDRIEAGKNPDPGVLLGSSSLTAAIRNLEALVALRKMIA